MPATVSSVRDNLHVVDEVYGPSADLYSNVLGVQSNASQEQIQAAFLQRRRDLFQRLELGQAVEKQMDAVILAARILGEPSTRLEYDDLRPERLQKTIQSMPSEPSYASIDSPPPSGHLRKKMEKQLLMRRRKIYKQTKRVVKTHRPLTAVVVSGLL